uniref:Uncharacterized protein n=1 Tax=Salix viminalis TaxID=40686 RepID=A0A6N2N543_SALVM
MLISQLTLFCIEHKKGRPSISWHVEKLQVTRTYQISYSHALNTSYKFLPHTKKKIPSFSGIFPLRRK